MSDVAEVEQPAVNPALKALFEIKVPDAPLPPDPDQPIDYPQPVAKTKRPEPAPEPVPPAPDPIPPVEPPKPDLTSRLAPDFAAELEAAPVVAKPTVVLDMPEEPPAHIKTPKAREDYQKWRKTTEELHREVETLRAKVNTPLQPVEDTESKALLAAAQEENRALLERVERYNLLDSPKFQQEYIQPRQKDFQRAQEIVKTAGGDPVALERAMALSGKARIDMLEEIAEAIPQQLQRDAFGRLIESIDDKTRTINEKLSNARAENEASKRQEKISNHQNLEKVEGELKTLLSAARRDLAENFKLETLQKVDKPGFEWWNEQIDANDKVAEEILLKSTPEKAAVAAHLAAAATMFRSMWQAERKALSAANQEIAELKGASPRMSQERKTPTADNGTAPNTNDILGRLQSGAYRK